MGPAPGPAANDSAFTYSGLSVYFDASSARTMIADAEPSETPEQSKMPSCPAMSGDAQMTSFGTSLRNCARGLRAPLKWFFHAIRVRTSFISSSDTSYFLRYAGASSENIAGAVSDTLVPSCGATAPTRPEKPESFSFSTPTAITMSYAPEATA